MKKKYIVNREFKYGEPARLLQPGDEFIPIGGKWDHVLTDPEKKYVRIEEVPEEKLKKKVTKKKATKKKPLKYKCDYCDRTFTSPQGKAAHQRACKQKE